MSWNTAYSLSTFRTLIPRQRNFLQGSTSRSTRHSRFASADAIGIPDRNSQMTAQLESCLQYASLLPTNWNWDGNCSIVLPFHTEWVHWLLIHWSWRGRNKTFAGQNLWCIKSYQIKWGVGVASEAQGFWCPGMNAFSGLYSLSFLEDATAWPSTKLISRGTWLMESM